MDSAMPGVGLEHPPAGDSILSGASQASLLPQHFDAQAALTPETGDETLKSAVTKAGLDPAAIDACAATQAIKDQVSASIKLAEDIGVEQTPMLAVNGHLLPLSGIPYETLKNIIAYQASLDGASTGATGPAVGSSSNPPTLGK